MTRADVLNAVARGEMKFVDRFKNMAMYTVKSGGNWQKTQSGPVATMQFKVGAKGRYVPSHQRDREQEELGPGA